MVLVPTGALVEIPAPSPSITVGFGIPKGDRAEWIIAKLTELGVDRIVPLLTDRTVVRLDATERIHRGDRFRRVAKEAAAQCRRVHLPTIFDPCTLDSMPEPVREIAVIAEPGGGPPGESTTILVGPEGGWSDRELALDFPKTALSDHILRAETAAVTAAVLMCAARSGIATLSGRTST